jgi:hypothetical protein
MYLYKKSQKFPVQIALYGTCPKIKKSLKNCFRPLGVNKFKITLNASRRIYFLIATNTKKCVKTDII